MCKQYLFITVSYFPQSIAFQVMRCIIWLYTTDSRGFKQMEASQLQNVTYREIFLEKSAGHTLWTMKVLQLLLHYWRTFFPVWWNRHRWMIKSTFRRKYSENDCKRFLTLVIWLIYNRHESYLHFGLHVLDLTLLRAMVFSLLVSLKESD